MSFDSRKRDDDYLMPQLPVDLDGGKFVDNDIKFTPTHRQQKSTNNLSMSDSNIDDIYGKRTDKASSKHYSDINTSAGSPFAAETFGSPTFTAPFSHSINPSPKYIVKGTANAPKFNMADDTETQQISEKPVLVPYIVNGHSSPSKIRPITKNPLRNGLTDDCLPFRNDMASAVATAINKLSFHSVSHVKNVKPPRKPLFTSYGVGRHIFGGSKDILPADALRIQESLKPQFGHLSAGNLGRADIVYNINYDDPECTFRPHILPKSRKLAKNAEAIKDRQAQRLAHKQAEAVRNLIVKYEDKLPLAVSYSSTTRKNQTSKQQMHDIVKIGNIRTIQSGKFRVAGETNIHKRDDLNIRGASSNKAFAAENSKLVMYSQKTSLQENETSSKYITDNNRESLTKSEKVNSKKKNYYGSNYVSKSFVDDFFTQDNRKSNINLGVKFEEIVVTPEQGVVKAANLVGIRAPAQIVHRAVVDYSVFDDEFNFTADSKVEKSRKSTVSQGRRSNVSETQKSKVQGHQSRKSEIQKQQPEKTQNFKNIDTNSIRSGTSGSSILPPGYVRPIFAVTHVSPPRAVNLSENLI